MPLFTVEAAISVEAPALHALADLIAAAEGFQQLNLGRTAEESREKVHVCESIDPWDSDRADAPDPKLLQKQLDELLLMAWVQPADDDGYETFEDPEAVASCPREGGTFEVVICRQILLGEWEEHGREQLYLWFLDCTSSIAHDIQQAATLAGTVLRRVRRVGRPKWNNDTEHSAQGRNLYAAFEVDWGDRGGEE